MFRYVCVCVSGFESIPGNETSCQRSTSPPSAMRSTSSPTPIPTATDEPTAAPTRILTMAPTSTPSQHSCMDGTHTCDPATASCVPALPVGSNSYVCECLVGFEPVPGSSTSCRTIAVTTRAPTLVPSASPTAPTSSTSNGQQPSNVSTNNASHSNSNNDKWWIWWFMGFLVALVLIGVIVAVAWARKNRKSMANTNQQTASTTRYPLHNPIYDQASYTTPAMGDASPPLYGELVPNSPVGVVVYDNAGGDASASSLPVKPTQPRTRNSEALYAQPHRVLNLPHQDGSPSRESVL